MVFTTRRVSHWCTKDVPMREPSDKHQETEQRAASIEAIETIQVVAALLAGTGIAFLDSFQLDDEYFSSLEGAFLHLCIMVFIGSNMFGLVVLSTQLFYLRQCLAKDIEMFDPFMVSTINIRYYAMKGVLYSMVVLIAVLGLKLHQFSGQCATASIGFFGFICLAWYCLLVMKKTRTAFATSRKRSKAKTKLKASMHAVRITTKAARLKDKRVLEKAMGGDTLDNEESGNDHHDDEKNVNNQQTMTSLFKEAPKKDTIVEGANVDQKGDYWVTECAQDTLELRAAISGMPSRSVTNQHHKPEANTMTAERIGQQHRERNTQTCLKRRMKGGMQISFRKLGSGNLGNNKQS